MGKKVDNTKRGEKVKNIKAKNVEEEENKEEKAVTRKQKIKEKVNKATTENKSKNKKKNNKENIDTNKESKLLDIHLENDSLYENLHENYINIQKEIKSKLIIDKEQVSKAVKCIKQLVHSRHQDTLNLLSSEKEELIYLNFVLGKLPTKYSPRPVSIATPNPLYGEKYNTRVCIFVKDPRSDFKDLKLEFPFKVKVIDIKKLKVNYERFEQRRNLLKEFEVFLCDYKIYFLLRRFLGKPFYSSRKYPVPMEIDYTNPEKVKSDIINRVEKTTTFYMTKGPNYSLKVARAIDNEKNIVENIVSTAFNVLPHILKWGLDLSR
jgi:hypothetical protein